MSIDRIGKGSAPPPPKPVTGAEKAQGAGAPKAFEVQAERVAASGQVAPVAAPPQGVGALDRLRAGEIDLDGYLDLKVSEATAHLQGMRATEIEGIRSMLRDQIAGDPALAELVQRATGQTPAAKG
jgi:hypothetical protein